jgi:hypothetical protein
MQNCIAGIELSTASMQALFLHAAMNRRAKGQRNGFLHPEASKRR